MVGPTGLPDARNAFLIAIELPADQRGISARFELIRKHDDPSVMAPFGSPAGIQASEVARVLGLEDSPLARSECQLPLVGLAPHVRLGRCEAIEAGVA